MQKIVRALLSTCLFFMVSSVNAQTIHVCLIGPGLVGSTLLKRIETTTKDDVEIKVVGIASSEKMYFNPKGIPLKEWKSLLDKSSKKMTLQGFIDKMAQLKLQNTVFVDCTSNQNVADTYETVLKSGISIVTPNKKANSGLYKDYKKLREMAAKKRVKFLYSANVRGGLPIISTIQSLKRCGDQIVKIEAILSGTLSYIFNTFK